MAKRDESELRVVESMKSLAAGKQARPKLAMRRRSAPTRAEALEAMRAMKGGVALIESIPSLGHTAAWSEAAYWGVCKSSGAAAGGTFLWDCDFPGVIWTETDAAENCIAYFAGADDLGSVIPPDILSGQVWCYMDAPTDGLYVFVAQLETYLDEYFGPDYTAVVECSIDSNYLGTGTLYPGQPATLPFVVTLSGGHHLFKIRQKTGGVFFFGVTAWQSLVLQPGQTLLGQ